MLHVLTVCASLVLKSNGLIALADRHRNWIAECSGIDLCEKLREFDPFVPILFYSGAAYDHDKQQAFAAGAQGYLVKPVDNDEVLKQLSRLISAARRTQSVTE